MELPQKGRFNLLVEGFDWDGETSTDILCNWNDGEPYIVKQFALGYAVKCYNTSGNLAIYTSEWKKKKFLALDLIVGLHTPPAIPYLTRFSISIPIPEWYYLVKNTNKDTTHSYQNSI